MEITRKKVSFHTIGCKLNFSETSAISRSFPEDLFEKVSAESQCDIYVINTCSVTEAADRKCRQLIKKLRNRSPEAIITVIGCYVQLNPNKIASIPGVDLLLGTNEKYDAANYLKNRNKSSAQETFVSDLSSSVQFRHSYSLGDRTRSFLKVQDGCDYHCSYCTVPIARGQSRNQDIRSLVKKAEIIAAKGIKEIVITGVNIGDFGKSTGESLSELIRELIKVNGIERYRLSSIEPNLLTDELIEMAADSEKVLHHFHIPLQSGNNKILRLMKRRYNCETFEDRIKAIREKIPMAGIGTDIIVGFPGETDTDFEKTLQFLTSLELTYLHVFNFSERPGTHAQQMPGKVPFATRMKRSRILTDLSEKKHYEFCHKNIGRTEMVLFEHKKIGNMISGFTGNYLRVEYPWEPNLVGAVKKVMLTGISDTGEMKAEIIY
jgi:threonylcarbamoyladenosine tRNA methylthiotransferase MtaB